MSVIPAYISGCHIGSGCSCRDILRGHTVPQHVKFRCAAGKSCGLFPQRLLAGCIDYLVCLIKSVTLRCSAGNPFVCDLNSLGIKQDFKTAFFDLRMKTEHVEEITSVAHMVGHLQDGNLFSIAYEMQSEFNSYQAGPPE